jgi:hypothetical protein
MAFLRVIYPVLTATTVVETVTETVVQPGRTVNTVTVLEGGDVVIRIESPGVKMIVYYEKQDQVCVVSFTALPYPSKPEIVHPGTTIVITGTTATFVLNAPTKVVTTSTLRTAFTTTAYKNFILTRTITTTVTAWRLDTRYGLITTTYTTTLTTPRITFLYGLIEETCNLAYEISRSSIIPARVPATVVIGFEGTAFTFPGFTYTISTEDMAHDLVLQNFKTILTVTKSGTTNTATVYIGPTTIVLNTRVEGSIVTTTVVVPGTTYVRTHLVTRTLAEPVATVTETRTAAAVAQPTQPQPAVTVTTPAPGERAGQLFDQMTLGIFVAVTVAVVVGVLLGYRRGRY